jgi:hypothetical protein
LGQEQLCGPSIISAGNTITRKLGRNNKNFAEMKACKPEF